MKSPITRVAMVAALTTLLLAPAAAQTGMPQEFGHSQDYWARIGEGDIPTTSVEEGVGWNVAEYVRFTAPGGEHRIPLASNAGTVLNVTCTCGHASINGTEILIPDVQGVHEVRLVRNFPSSSGILVDFALYGGQPGRIYAYVPNNHHVDTSATMVDDPLACTGGAPCTIHQYQTGGGMHFAMLPGPAATATTTGNGGDGIANYVLPILLGALGGVLLWAFLVQRGYVQRRRRQEVAASAHTVAAGEGKPLLLARKRVLMAGLKDLEMARMNKEVEDAAYDKLKAELKKETVTVMRALEEGKA